MLNSLCQVALHLPSRRAFTGGNARGARSWSVIMIFSLRMVLTRIQPLSKQEGLAGQGQGARVERERAREGERERETGRERARERDRELGLGLKVWGLGFRARNLGGGIARSLGAHPGKVQVPVERVVLHLCSDGRYKATWKRGFKIPWRKAGPLKLSRWLSGFGPVGCR